ncbi:D site albumin promoter binding protein b isoform X1 [Sphaeramia orbicularis]|uniref:D site albumin promoter binding protein b isoform X1 n=1 Tax=Sphaeramia orbicularis TaxID=375764 RepID=UPI00117EDFEE|nr:thyrotroph embryonic factor-like isoform X1 [Sphaeramia orbicularis]XP_030014456.1 thyrotroph embryonic factor-like isoform X1 [Sphaeramia orbicularis]
MSRQLSQLPTPDLPAGASPQFGSCTQPAGSLTGGQLTSMAGLKSLLQHPMKGDQRLKSPCDVKADKDRSLDLDEDSLGVCSMRSGSGISSSNSSTGCGGNGGGNFNQFLGPLLWDRTLPADGGLFQLQYMDLEEFLTENGMGSMHNNNSSSSAQVPSQSPQSAVPNQSSQCLPSSSPPCSTSSSPSSSSSPSLIGLEVAQPQNVAGGTDCLHGSQTSMNDSCESPSSSSSSCPPLLTPTGSGPDGIGMFDMDASSGSSQQNFDPRRHTFSEEELKPQPMIKKARKILVPDNMKDEKYWTRRYKNNEAAKRSRDARRLKENQISVRAAYLERENAALRQEVAEMRKELGRCRNILSKYENRLADQ